MKVNGKEILLEKEITITEFLKVKDLKEDRIVVELNRVIVEKKDFKHITLKRDDEVEIIAFVGGG